MTEFHFHFEEADLAREKIIDIDQYFNEYPRTVGLHPRTSKIYVEGKGYGTIWRLSYTVEHPFTRWELSLLVEAVKQEPSYSGWAHHVMYDPSYLITSFEPRGPN